MASKRQEDIIQGRAAESEIIEGDLGGIEIANNRGKKPGTLRHRNN